MEYTSTQTGQWAEHWVACQLVVAGWRVKFLGDAVPSYDMIAYHPDFGARTVQVKGQRLNSGAIDLGPQETFTADVLVIVHGSLGLEPAAFVYTRSEIISADTIEGAGASAFVCNPGIVKKTGKRHVWTHRRNHPDPAAREAWERLKLPK